MTSRYLQLMESLDDKTVEAFIEGFFGYGNWAAPIWFVGMEEGGGESVAEIRRRIDAWSSRGQQHDLEDLVEYHEAIGVMKHLGKRAKLQPTWSKLVHVLLGIRGEVARTPDAVQAKASDENISLKPTNQSPYNRRK